jgi:hypothetical protein
MAGSFLATMFLVIGVSEWLLPNWAPGFLRVVRAYRHYTYGHSLLDVWFTPTWGPIVAALVLFAVLALCWKHRSHAPSSPEFVLVTSLVLAATLVIIPTLAPHAQLLLLPGISCLHQSRTLPLSSRALPRLFLAATWALLAWPWIAVFALLLAAMVFPVHALLRFWELPLYSSPVLPVAVLLGLSYQIPASSRRNQNFGPSQCQP